MDWIDGIHEAWGREYPELDIGALPPMVRIARLGVLIESFQQQVVEPFDLSASDYGVLATLRRAGAPYALSPSMLYSRLRRSSGGMTKMLKRLEERGLVRREADPNDGRGSLVSLTESGLELQEQIFNAFLAASTDLMAPLGRSKRREVDRGLQTVLEAFEHYLEQSDVGDAEHAETERSRAQGVGR